MPFRRKPFRLTSGVARAPRAGNITKNNILKIIETTGDGIATTALSHGLTGSEIITLTGCGIYNGVYSIVGGDANVTGATTIQLVGVGNGNTSGGRWD